MMANDILQQLNHSKDSLLDALAAFPEQDFNKNFSEGSWSAGQVALHVYKSLSGVLLQMKAPAVPTSRDPREKEKMLRDTFLDFSVKFKSPEFVLPGDVQVDKQEIENKLSTVFDRLAIVIETQDISLTTTGFELPGVGPATRAEWIWFGIYHTQRHIRQIKNLHAAADSGNAITGSRHT